MRRILTLVAFIGVMHGVGFLRIPGTPHGSGTLFLGFLLLASYLAGRASRVLALPQITGYLVIGLLVGPYVLDLVPRSAVAEFRFVNGVALALIALSAGGELRLGSVRERLRSIGIITATQTGLLFLGVSAAVYLVRGGIPFLHGQPPRVGLAVALLFGLVAVAKSPATTIAVIMEEGARGPLTETVLGITVVKDVVILVLIALLLPLATTIVNPELGFDYTSMVEILLEIVGSLGLGAGVGWLVSLYLGRVRVHPILFVLAVAFLAVKLGEWLHMESILLAMAAGFYVQNFSPAGPRLIRALEVNSLPLYALFFAVAGADLNLGVLADVWLVAGVLVVARLLLLYVSTWAGASAAGDPDEIRHHAWLGFVAQAGVTLGIANMVRDRFPIWGLDVATIIIAMIAVNQLLGPPAFRFAILRAGESRASRERRKVRPAHR